MEVANQKALSVNVDGANLDYLVYQKYNKNLKDRLTFINRVMDWNNFAEEL